MLQSRAVRHDPQSYCALSTLLAAWPVNPPYHALGVCPREYAAPADMANSAMSSVALGPVDAEIDIVEQSQRVGVSLVTTGGFVMPNIPNPNSIPAVLPSDFVKDDIPAETDDLQLGHRNPENPDSDPVSKPRRTVGPENDPYGGRQ